MQGPARILQTYNLARGTLTFRPEDFPSSPLELAERAALAEALSAGTWPRPLESNNWTISGRLTASGRPILSNDPHRAQSIPSLRYMAHLNGPGWNVIGAGEPALPGISIGHNNRIAFGLTIFAFADEEDLYVYDTNPDNPSQYRYRDRWESMRVLRETVDVRDGPAVQVELKFTRHGPVLFEDTTNQKAYALRAAYLEISWHGGLSRQPTARSGARLESVPARHGASLHAEREHGLRRWGWQHRLDGR